MTQHINLNDIYTFHYVSELGSITSASKKLNTSKQTISRKLAQLEEDLGVTLVARNSRSFKLTQAGEDYQRFCVKIIKDVEEANLMLRQHKTAMEGTIKISMCHEFSGKNTCDLFLSFMEKNPAIKLDINLCCDYNFSLSDGYDLSLCLGELQNSSLVGRHLGEMNYALVASPSYLQSAGMPTKCEDLVNHVYIAVAQNSGKNEKDLPFLQCKQLGVNDFQLAKQFATQGYGLTRLPLYFCNEQLLSGDLVVLPSTRCIELKPVNLVYMKDKFMPSYVRSFVDHLVGACRESTPWITNTELFTHQESSPHQESSTHQVSSPRPEYATIHHKAISEAEHA